MLAAVTAAAALVPGAAAARSNALPRVVVEYTNPYYAVMGVDSRGVSYGVNGDSAHQNALYTSSDEARTWTPAYYFATGSRVVLVRPLAHSTILAGVLHGSYQLWRSDDNGRSWDKVFRFPKSNGLLTPHSIATDGHGNVVMAAYNYFKNPGNHRVPIWRSGDDGRTWKTVKVVTTSRHAHCASYDPYTGDMYVCLGDWGPQSQILRSSDGGKTWSVFIRGWDDRAVDLTFDRSYVYFGQDNQTRDAIIRASKATGATSVVHPNSLGASYSALRLRNGMFLVGETFEPSGSIYAGQHEVHLFASRDGSSWVDVLRRPVKPDAAGYAYIDAYYQYPDGSVPLLVAGFGTVVVRAGPPFPPETLSASHRLAVRRTAPTSPTRPVVQSPALAGASTGSGAFGIGLALFAAAAVMLAGAAAVWRVGLDRGAVAFGSIVVQPVQLVAGAVSLLGAGILAALLS